MTVAAPKLLILDLMGILKGGTATRDLQLPPCFKKKPHWGDHFSAPGYCIATVGLDAESIRKYFKSREKKE